MLLEFSDFVFVANAGSEGGVTWIDLQERRIIQTLSTPPGLSAPAAVGGGRYLASAVPGKSKARFFGTLTESREPLSELYVFEVSGIGGNKPVLKVNTHSLPAPAQHALAIDPDNSDIVALASEDEILVVRASTGQILDRKPALGKIYRVTSR